MVRGGGDGHWLREERLPRAGNTPPDETLYLWSRSGEVVAWLAVLLLPRTCNLFNRPENAWSYGVFFLSVDLHTIRT